MTLRPVCVLAEIACECCPSAFAIKRCDPFFIRRVVGKFVSQCHDLVLVKQHVQRSRHARRKIVVDEQLQAASLDSNATASRT
jgi:hypothetical protein